jgi:hypothetical protein
VFLFAFFDVFGDRKKAVLLKGVNAVISIIDIFSLKHIVQEFAKRTEVEGVGLQDKVNS